MSFRYPPTALNKDSGTTRGWEQNSSASFLQRVLGREGIRSAIFPHEEAAREQQAETSLFHQTMSTIAVKKLAR
jgi:hypothetical protein